LRADERVRVQRRYEFVLGAGSKAKTVTSNLPLLSVLGGRAIIQVLSFETLLF
jgi:hypothetical protein